MFQAQFVRIFSFVGRCSDQEQSIFSVYLSRLPGYNFFPLHTEETRDNGFVSHGLSVVDPNIWRHPIRPVVECPRARFFPFFFFFSLSFSLSFFFNRDGRSTVDTYETDFRPGTLVFAPVVKVLIKISRSCTGLTKREMDQILLREPR